MEDNFIYKCPITDNDEYVTYFKLGDMPLVNNLCSTRDESLTIDKFPLNLNYYLASGETSLDYVVDSKLLFNNYLFKSSVNTPYINHCEKMFDFIQEYVKLESNDLIIDIGGNDGSLLLAFKSKSTLDLDLLNIDPSQNLTQISKEKGIPVENEFFNIPLANKYAGKASIITSTNVFQHLQDINSFVEGINIMLKPNGIWVLEFPYWIHDMKTNQFDQIYHEHVYYHSITPLNILMKKHKLKIVNITKQNIHGGTLRLIIAKESSAYVPDITLEAYLQLETNYKLDYHIKWGKDIYNYIHTCRDSLKTICQNYKVYGFGAAAKGCIFLNTLNITHNDIPYIADDTDIKQNKYIPGTGIQIIDRYKLIQDNPDYVLILAHNFASYIMESLKKDGYKGKFIILVPNFTIIE